MTEYFCRLHLLPTHTNTQNLGSYTKKRKKREKPPMHTAKEKKNFEDFIQEIKKTLVSIRTRSRLNHHYETQTVRSVIIFRFYAISATN